MDEYNEVPQSEEEAEEQAPRRPGTDLFEWLQLFLGCVIVAVVLFNCAARLTRVDGESMDNTLQHGEILLIWSLGYTPQQGDVVVLNKTSALLPGWTEPHAIVKRVIATGGQTVDIDYMAGLVYVDGQPLDEPYAKEPTYTANGTPFPITLAEDEVFVMGDNRNHSSDSRDARLGPVKRGYLQGKALLLLTPGATPGTEKRDWGRIGPLR